jgi:lipopolysaccharide/colanic/teichoic acid biosynthesis glycosyltransferase
MATPGKLLSQSDRSGPCILNEADAWTDLRQSVLRGESAADKAYFACKRCLDFLVAGALLLFLSPLFLLIALLIKLDSLGPVLFTQERVGARRAFDGKQVIWVTRKFTIYKFRSMVANADPSLHESYVRNFVEGQLQALDVGRGIFKLTQDPRVTRLGHFLRRFSLDELPQLFNVLKGEMSLVGPRPVPSYEVACYRDGYHRRLAALPGITGLWQIKGRGRVSFEEMVRMDVEYIRNASLWLDFGILCLTIPAVLSRRGAV